MQRNLKNGKTPNTSNGITLVALVITIIVLLILAGVAINMAINSDGIFGKANEATEKWNESVEKEETAIDELLAELGVINWEKAMAEAKAPASQDEARNAGVIGIGTDGKPVDMDLWEYKLMADGTYGLNDTESLAASGTRTNGYLGAISNGKIEGTIPQYIKSATDSKFIEVTNISWAFYNNQEIKEAPIIPTTVENMYNTFNGCILLNTVNLLPDNVTNMQGTFNGCVELQTVNNLPANLENMSWTFQNCTKLEKVPNIPNNVTNMIGSFKDCKMLRNVSNIPDKVNDLSMTFQNCAKLEKVPNIPASVTNMKLAFQNCTSLTEIDTIIPANVTNMYATFMNCTSLSEININIPESVTNMRNLFNGCAKLCGNINIIANISLEKEADGYYAYDGWLNNAATESEELLILGPTENRTIIESIKPNNSNIKGAWEI